MTQIKRSAGQSVVASAAYRSGEKLHSEYYGEDSDYTRKGGVVCSEILLPPHAPQEYADRETLWNAVEKAEHGKKAQLAYSFDIALQNEFSTQENIALARQFLLDQFVSRGMVVDFAVHQPDRDDGGIQNPHFHVLCPIRPILPDGRWGSKQRREYVLDEHGERIRDEAGDYVFNAVPTTDWGSPDTLEHWRQAWAELCNAKFAEKGLDCRIDHRSYERQGVEQLPTVHEGPTVKAMEQKGIRTDKGDLNRWIRKTNAMLREAKQKIASLIGWLKDVKAELSVPQPPTLVELLSAYYDTRNKGAYSGKAKLGNLKKFSETVSYLESKQLRTTEDLDALLNAIQIIDQRTKRSVQTVYIPFAAAVKIIIDRNKAQALERKHTGDIVPHSDVISAKPGNVLYQNTLNFPAQRRFQQRLHTRTVKVFPTITIVRILHYLCTIQIRCIPNEVQQQMSLVDNAGGFLVCAILQGQPDIDCDGHRLVPPSRKKRSRASTSS